MILTLTLCLSASGWWGAIPPSLPRPGPGRLRDRAIEQMHREQLQLAKNRGRGLEQMIEMFERQLKDPSGLGLRPEQVDSIKRQVELLRARVQFMKNLEAVLESREQQKRLAPGPEADLKAIENLERLSKEWDDWKAAWERGVHLAPMPREVKQ